MLATPKCYIPLVAIAVVTLSGCNSPRVSSNCNDGFSAYEKFHDLLDRRKYYEACLLIDEVEYELRDIDEGGIGVEYQKLTDWVAGSGQHDWNRIFASPDISLGIKYSIIESIHSNVTYEEPERIEADN